MPAQRHMNTRDVCLSTQNSCYSRRPPFVVLAVDDRVPANMLLLVIEARMLKVGQRGKERSVGGCNPSDSR